MENTRTDEMNIIIINKRYWIVIFEIVNLNELDARYIANKIDKEGKRKR